MATSKAVEDRVTRFMAEILGLVERARSERHSAVLSAVSSMLAGQRPRTQDSAPPKATPRPPPTKAITAAKRRGRPPGAKTAAKPAATPKPGRRARHPRLNLVPSASTPVVDERQQDLFPAAPVAANEPAAPKVPPPPEDTGDRQARVLEAVRTLVRPTARDVAEHCGLPNPATYAALRALVEDGKLAKTDGVRGQEYSLVSSGGIRPSKRTKRAAPPEPSEGRAPEVVASSASESPLLDG